MRTSCAGQVIEIGERFTGFPMGDNPKADPVYAWQRFWVPREGSIDLSDGGFLRDPQSEFAQHWLHPLKTLPELQHFQALALLGEPGIGKSVTLETEYNTSKQQHANDDRLVLHVDLR